VARHHLLALDLALENSHSPRVPRGSLRQARFPLIGIYPITSSS
jgi:hypothetical protein